MRPVFPEIYDISKVWATATVPVSGKSGAPSDCHPDKTNPHL
jgi:hypothetical protein